MRRAAAAWLACLLVAAPLAAQESDSTAPASDDELTRLSRRLGTRLSAALSDGCLANARTAVVVRELAGGRMLFRRSGNVPLVPASNLKLVTAGAALSLLGPEHLRRTELRSDQRPDERGRVGTLYAVGGGDPSLNVESLYLIARALASAGVRQVDRIVADASYFDGPLRVPSWPESNHRHWYGAPTDALSAAYNVVAVHARGGAAGSTPSVWVDPFPGYFEVVSSVRSGRGPLTVSSRLLARRQPGDPVQRIELSGHVRPGRSERVLRAVEQPALFAAHGLQESLRRVGIQVAAPPRVGTAPPDSVLLHSHASKPLGLLVHDMNKQSSNVFAETMLKVLGGELLGPPGTREKGLAVLDSFLSELVGPGAGAQLRDGSGLSPESRLSADALVALVFALSRDPQIWPEFLVTLPVSGVDGTLKRRLREPDSRRLVRAKTGRLKKVVSLTGLAPVGSGRSAVFSVLVNDYACATWKVQDAVDAVVRAIAAEAPPAPEPRALFRTEATKGASDDGEAELGGD